MGQIQVLKQQDINHDKWNACVAGAPNSLPYAYTWYLDAVAKNWDGLVYGNYEAVMPLVWLHKYALRAMYQPYYCQQLGVFGAQLSNELLSAFLKQATDYAPYIDINLNAIHRPNEGAFKLTPRKNLLLPLQNSYGDLKKVFSENHRRNIAKGTKAGLFFKVVEDLDNFREFYLASINREREKFDAAAEAIFKKLLSALYKNNSPYIYGAYLNNELVAAVVLIPAGQRMISIINASNETGKKVGASHFVYNKVIEKYAESNYLLDFEGSSVVSIARFYEGFGAQQETFYRWRTNIVKRISQRLM